MTVFGLLDGVHHQHLGINLNNLDLFAVFVLSSATPDSPSARPWLYGKVVSVQQLNANTVLVTWTVSTSANGVSFARS